MKRREFIKTAAAAGIGVGLLSCTNGRAGSSAAPRPYKVNGTERMSLSFFPYELQLAHTFTVASYSRTTTPDVQVEIAYDGFVGYGEASMPQYLGHTVESVCSFLSKVRLEQFPDPFCIEDILAYVDSLSEGDAPAKAAIDIALHDLVGKLLGQPLFRLWGYDPTKAPATSFTIGIDTPDVVRTKTLECTGRFKVLKIKVGLDNDEEMVKTVRSVTDLPLVVDANQGWTDRQKALDEICWLSTMGVRMVEQPMPFSRIDDIAWITERSPVPIFADEGIQRLRDLPDIRGAYSGINVKLMKCTGLAEARKMIAWARAEGMKVMLGCMTETSCAVTAAAHLAPAVDFADLDGNLLISNDRFSGMTIEDGLITLPDRPGLGLTAL